MQVEIDRAVCIAAGQCAVAAPFVFTQADDDGLVVLLAQPSADQYAAVGEAALRCPAGAIHLAGLPPTASRPGGG